MSRRGAGGPDAARRRRPQPQIACGDPLPRAHVEDSRSWPQHPEAFLALSLLNQALRGWAAEPDEVARRHLSLMLGWEVKNALRLTSKSFGWVNNKTGMTRGDLVALRVTLPVDTHRLEILDETVATRSDFLSSITGASREAQISLDQRERKVVKESCHSGFAVKRFQFLCEHTGTLPAGLFEPWKAPMYADLLAKAHDQRLLTFEDKSGLHCVDISKVSKFDHEPSFALLAKPFRQLRKATRASPWSIPWAGALSSVKFRVHCRFLLAQLGSTPSKAAEPLVERAHVDQAYAALMMELLAELGVTEADLAARPHLRVGTRICVTVESANAVNYFDVQGRYKLSIQSAGPGTGCWGDVYVRGVVLHQLQRYLHGGAVEYFDGTAVPARFQFVADFLLLDVPAFCAALNELHLVDMLGEVRSRELTSLDPLLKRKVALLAEAVRRQRAGATQLLG